ncbi:hypothetical protein BC826DRAFT_1058530 [Russula brevipes]|nr:hypothetical protein BC826DRAFT_1058530 [Russula brevipes]
MCPFPFAQGDWAGNVYSESGCPGTCVDCNCQQSCTSFSEAYWEINSLRVYGPDL